MNAISVKKLTKKYLSSITLLLIFVLTLSGCYPTGDVSLPESVSSAEGVTVNVTLSGEIPESVPEITMRLREWDNDRLIDLFLDGSGITSENSFDTVRNAKRYVYETGDDQWLISENGYISYSLHIHGQENSIPSYYNRCYMPELFPDEELEGFSKEDALEKAYEIIGKVGLTHLGEPEIYAVTAERTAGLSTITTKWTRDDELYYIRFPVVYNSVPVIDCPYDVMGTGEVFPTGSYADVAVSRSGIVFFNCCGIFGEVQKESEKIPVRISGENALDIFKAFFAGREHSPVNVVGCTLTYMPSACKESQEYSFRPAWRIEFVQESGLSLPYTKRIIYDAATGVQIMDYTG